MPIDFKKSISDPPAEDPGNVAIQKRIVSETLQFGLFVDNDNAVWAANNKLQKSSYPLLPFSFTANRNLFKFQAGDVFRGNYAPYGIVDKVIRVLSIEQEDMNSENIIVTGKQDFFSISRYASDLGTPVDNSGEPPNYDCEPFEDQAIFENPWILSNSVQLIPVASRLTNLITGFSIYMSLDGGDSYSILTSSTNIQTFGELSQDYGLTYAIDRDTGIYVDFKNDMDSIENETWSNVLSGSKNMAILGGTEIISFQNITPITETIYLLENVIRGRWGTVRKEHLIGDSFWFIQKNIELLNDSQILTGATRKFKFVPYNSQKQGSLVDAVPIDITIEGESQKPYEPNNFRANGESFNPLYVSGTDITLTWTPRVRGKGAGSMISGVPVITNTDHEGLFRIEVWVSAVKVRDTIDTAPIDDITWDYTDAMNVIDNTTPADIITFVLFNYIVYDGITYESDGVAFICNKE